MKNLFFVLSFFFTFILFHSSFAQQNTFSKVYEENMQYGIQVFSVAPTLDSSFILVGELGYQNGIIIKVDAQGEMLWNKVFGQDISNPSLWFTSITPTYDSCFFIAGKIRNENGSFGDAFYTKINMHGDTIWTKSHAFGNISIEINSVDQTTDSGFIMTGHTNEQSAPNQRLFVAKADRFGNHLWSKIFIAGNGSNIGYSTKQMPDNNCLIAGNFSDYNPNQYYSFLLELSPDGEIIWNKSYHIENSQCEINDVIIKDNSIVSYMNIGWNNALMETDLTGEILWSKTYQTYGGTNMTGQVRPKIFKASDDAYIFAYTDYFWSGGIVKTDLTGDIIWHKDLFLLPMDITESPNHEYFIIGNGPLQGVKNNRSSYEHVGIIQTDSLGDGQNCISEFNINYIEEVIVSSTTTFSVVSGGQETTNPVIISSEELAVSDGCVDIIGGVDETISNRNPIIYPNPNNGIFSLENADQKEGFFMVYNRFGQLIYQKEMNHSQLPIDLSKQTNGVYLYKFVSPNHETSIGKFIIQK